MGNIDLNDSMSTKLLQNDRQRKKDFGTTSYKKPGPPTPSKNGGRPSLQGNEPHLNIETKTPKRTTPNRIKSFFKKRNSGVGDTSEVGLPEFPLPSKLYKHLSKDLCRLRRCAHSCHGLPLTKSPKVTCIPERKAANKSHKTDRMKKIIRKLLSCTTHIIFVISMVVATQYIKSLTSE